MKGWTRTSLEKFVQFQRGFDLPKGQFIDGEVPVYGSTSILGFHNVAKVKAPGVITGRSGTLGKFQYANADFWPHNTSLWVKDFKGNDPRFAYYLMHCLDFESFNSGGAVPTLNRNVLKAFIIDVPPLPTQQKIASILSAYDDLIENNLKRIKLLEEMAQITYEEWFVRLRFPGHESTPLNPETGLPVGWEKDLLGKYIKFIKGKKVDKSFSEYTEGRVKIMLLDSLESGNFKYTTPDKHVPTKRGDLVMCMDGARSSYVYYAEGGIVGSTMAKIKTTSLPASLLYLFFKTILKSLQSNNTGAAIPHANKSYINNIEFPIPSNSILLQWDSYILKLNSQIWNLKDQNQRLREARDILLPRLMTGMIDVESYNPGQLLEGVA